MAAIPTRVNNLVAYDSSGVKLGAVSEATLPSVELQAENLTGAGIMGEIEVPSLGRVQPMTLTLNWRVVTRAAVSLLAQGSQSLELRGAIEAEDDSGGGSTVQKLRVIVVGRCKVYNPGNLSPNSVMDASHEFACSYYKLELDDEVLAEIDQYNSVFSVLGTDYMADVRAALEG
jgi:uncharacterized protein